MRSIPEGVEVTVPDDVGCFGCSTEKNPRALGLRFRREGESVSGDPVVPSHLSGGPGMVHGGIVSLLLDEYSCAAALFLRGTVVVTGELNVRFEAPCPVERRLHVVARIVDESHPRYRVIEAEVLLDGTRVARSTGKFFPAATLTP